MLFSLRLLHLIRGIPVAGVIFWKKNGRGAQIRTAGLCVPNAALCQAELRPEMTPMDKPTTPTLRVVWHSSQSRFEIDFLS